MGDFLESLLFTGIVNGVGVVWKKSNALRDTPNSLYVLDINKIDFPEGFDKNVFINRSQKSTRQNIEVVYDSAGENIKIKMKELLFFYDLPNGIYRNPNKTSSRISGLRQTLINTKDSLIAKNIILKSNGKELVSGAKDGFPLTPQEKEEVEGMFNRKYGLSHSRKRGIVVNSTLTHKSLHIALRDLGLDESVKVDGNLIYTALHIPKDILSLEAKKTTYSNFKESMVSYVQNEIKPTLDAHLEVFNTFMIDDNVELVGDYEHLPIMQFVLIERYKGVSERAKALQELRKAGLPDDMALELVGLDPNTPLGELQIGASMGREAESGGDAASETEEEKRIRKLINGE